MLKSSDRVFVVLCALTVPAVLALGGQGSGGAKPAATKAPPGGPNPTVPPTVTAQMAIIPPDIPKGAILGQNTFDFFSWQEFIALNWPADPRNCVAKVSGGTTILNGTGPRVWETYLTDGEVFVPPGQQPSPWCPQVNAAAANASLARRPEAVQKLAAESGVRRFLSARSKFSPALAHTFPGVLEAFGGPLVDQNGRFVRYEVHLNKDEYDYLINPSRGTPTPGVNLWSKSGQALYAPAISFPVSPTGAIEVKAAWKVITKGRDDPSRFYTIRAIVYDDSLGTCPLPRVETLGLVGFHIIHKTKIEPNWIWSTFEHVDNVFEGPKADGKPRSFASANCPPYGAGPGCPTPNTQTAVKATVTPCPSGTPTSAYVELNAQATPINTPAQVTRVQGPVENVWNPQFRKLLAGSVWANYQLVSTQWTGNLNPLGEPPFLANTTLETFNQGPTPPTDGTPAYPALGYQPFSANVSSSCLKCHSLASRVAGGSVTPTVLPNTGDRSFLINTAQ